MIGTHLKFITVKPLNYPESGGIENYGYIPKGTVCETEVVEGCEAVLHDRKVVCDVDSGMVMEYFREMENEKMRFVLRKCNEERKLERGRLV